MSRLVDLSDPHHLPALRPDYAHRRPAQGLGAIEPPPRILLLYGSLRERSYSRLVVEEAARLLIHFGCEVRIFNPADLPLPDQVSGDDHPAVVQPGTAWADHRDHEKPDRPFAAGHEGDAPNARPHIGGDAGLRRVAIVQYGQHFAHSGPMDADVHHPQPVLCGQSL